MSGNDADLSAAHSLIELRRRNESRNESDKNSEDGCGKSTTIDVDTFIRRPLRDSSNNNSLLKNVGGGDQRSRECTKSTVSNW